MARSAGLAGRDQFDADPGEADAPLAQFALVHLAADGDEGGRPRVPTLPTPLLVRHGKNRTSCESDSRDRDAVVRDGPRGVDDCT